MCGIAGFSAPGADADAILRRMTMAVAHRGPDAEGHWVDSAVAMGHRRLTVIDPIGGQQPRVDTTTRDVLVFNGEIYDYRRHAAALRADGVPLRDASDTEVLFQMLRRYGVSETLKRIDGMFAFAFCDGRSGQISLARDRFGEKPLFYAVIDGVLIFASELKALRRHPLCARVDFDLEAIGAYLTFDYVPAPRTGFARLCKLPPAHRLTFTAGDASVEPYWRIPSSRAAMFEGSREEAVDHLDTLLRRSIETRLVADVPVGVFLSGGIDSALIAALASDYTPGIAAYTIRFEGQGYDETPYAAAVAAKYGLRHEVRDVSDASALRALDSIETKLDEPFADASIVPTYLVCEAARAGVTVALGGDGADELFAGYMNFQAGRMARLMARLPRVSGPALRALLAALPASDRYMSLPFKLAQLSQGFGAPAAHQAFLWMAPFSDAARRPLRVDPLPVAGGLRTVDAIAEDAPNEDTTRLMQRLFTSIYLPDDILTKVDRASMYNSLEVRAPYLAREIAEFAFSLPSSWQMNGITTKYLLRRLAERYLPDDLVRRGKHGFALPVAGMLRGALRERVTDVLLDRKNPLAGLFRRVEIERLLAAHMSGRRDHRKRLWSLYALFRFAATAAPAEAAARAAAAA
jgi:asparagine synthase (glutamine-hydrolysing)